MTFKTMAALLLIATIALLIRSDYGFYRPVAGALAAGQEEVQQQAHQREVVRLTIRAEDLQRFANALTIKRLSEFYGVDDSLPCSIRYTFSNTDPELATRKLRTGQVVSLCLN